MNDQDYNYMSSLTKEDEEEVRLAVENNEYVALSYVKQLLDEIDSLRSELSFINRNYGEADNSELTNDAIALKCRVLENQISNERTRFGRILKEKCKVDGEVYNLGREEGRSDIAVSLRKIVDPSDINHWNIDGTLKEVERLVKFKDQTELLITYLYQSSALKEFAYERGDDELSMAEMLRAAYKEIKSNTTSPDGKS